MEIAQLEQETHGETEIIAELKLLLLKITGSVRGGDLMMNRTIPFTVKVGKWVMVCISQLVTIPNPLRI